MQYEKKIKIFQKTLAMRIYSSVGRALGSHSRGQGFESPYLHHKRRSESCGVLQFNH